MFNIASDSVIIALSMSKFSKLFTYKLILSFMVISAVCRSFILNKTTFTNEYCLIQWISKLPRSFEIHWVRQCMVNFMGLVGRVSTSVYKNKHIFTGLGHRNCPNFNTVLAPAVIDLLSRGSQNDSLDKMVADIIFFIYFADRKCLYFHWNFTQKQSSRLSNLQ